MREKTIRPVGLKGNDKLTRMKQLMGESVDKDTKNYVIELTKKGPDGKIYAIVRENHQYFIKVTDKTKNIIAEDFKYIGGLQNKNECVYHSYSKAIKQLNLKFINLSEAYNSNEIIDTFIDDNLIDENAIGASSMGFSDTTVFQDEDSMKEQEDINGEESPEDKKTSGDNLDGGFDEDINESSDLLIGKIRMKISNAIEENFTDIKKKV